MSRAIWNGTVIAQSDRCEVVGVTRIFRQTRLSANICATALRILYAGGRALRIIMMSLSMARPITTPLGTIPNLAG
jgi:hypothetical protein